MPFLCINSDSGELEYFTFADNMSSEPPPGESELPTTPHHETCPIITHECGLQQTHDCIHQPFDDQEYAERCVRNIQVTT
jgi:hypothetical protein